MRALVTGGTGFIGQHLVNELLKQGWDLVCTSRKKITPIHPAIQVIHGDLNKPETFLYPKDDLGTIDVIFHLAAIMPNDNKIQVNDYLNGNIIGTANLLKTFQNINASSFIYFSSISVIGKPSCLPITEIHPVKPKNPYSLSKLTAEFLCEQLRETDKQIVSLRLSSPYGPVMPGKSVLPKLVKAALHSNDVTIYGSGKRKQNFIHINDIVRACLLSVDSKTSGVFNLGGPSSTSMNSLGRLIVSVTENTKSKITHLDKEDSQEDYMWDIDTSKAENSFGYRPEISIEEGIKKYITFLQKQPKTRTTWWDS